MITDSCPECGSDHLDIQALAFAKIAKPEVGRIKVNYRRVECLVPSDMKVSVADFSGSGGWIRLSVDDTGGRGAVKQLYVKGSGESDWRAMDNTFGAAWELSSSPSVPLDFKFVCDDGEEVVASGVVKQNGGISGGLSSPVSFSTGKQFTINDPAATTVTASDGPNDPMLVTSTTPGATDGGSSSSSSSSSSSNSSSSSSSSGSSSNSSCEDKQPSSGGDCNYQKAQGNCEEDWLKSGGYCQKTCGACGSSSGRRLLLGGRKSLSN
jgi:Expansin C-terminal domain